jgi:predicted O-linked N-acetylglucosamine transferase (SPINDLY family)
LGFTLNKLGKFAECESAYRDAIALKPDHAEAYNNLAIALEELGKFDEAEASARQALSLKSDYAQAHNTLAVTLKELGRLKEAAESLRHAISLKPDYAEARHNLLFTLNYDHRLSAADLYSHYAAYDEVVSELTKHCFTHNQRPQMRDRRVRIGYSSPDFRGHVCRYFMEPIFRNHDRDQFELFAYSNTPSTDQHTERMKGYFDHWVDVVRMTDEEMAQRIYDDQIDILVDMAGHTKGNRLPVFAMRPAPIQASSFIGFGYTTGLSEIDYFLCDENLVPEGSEEYFSEEPYRLPAPGYAYEPPREETPEVSELPALRNGYVTFGSLTRTIRINDPLLRVWSEILERVPNSRLRLDQKSFAHEGMRELFWQRLEGLGLPRERVELTCSTPHWNAYHDIDITLDCWPHNAGTTTLESLWMGVPVLSKIDRASVGRIGAAALKPLGLEDWLVETAEAYVERAVSFASDIDALSKLRAELRGRVDQGPHLDAATITGHLESAYRQMIKSFGEV